MNEKTPATREALVVRARQEFTEWANSFEADHEIVLDESYFSEFRVTADVMCGFHDRLIHVVQFVTDELGSVDLIIVSDEDYETIKVLTVEVDTDYTTIFPKEVN